MSELTKALVAAQAEMKNPAKNAENPHFKSKFADLAALRDATLPALTKHGLSIHHATAFTSDPNGGALRFVLVCKLEHVSGETRESVWPLPADGKPQDLGSALTYGRRYTWAAMCGVASEDDDDGQAAQNAKPAAKPKPKVQPTTPATPGTASGASNDPRDASGSDAPADRSADLDLANQPPDEADESALWNQARDALEQALNTHAAPRENIQAACQRKYGTRDFDALNREQLLETTKVVSKTPLKAKAS